MHFASMFGPVEISGHLQKTNRIRYDEDEIKQESRKLRDEIGLTAN